MRTKLKTILIVFLFSLAIQSQTIETYISSSNTGITIDMTKPAFVEVGDLLVIMVATDDDQAADEWKPLSGWTKLNEAGNNTADCHVAAYYRIADGTEGISTTVSATASNDLAGVYARISDVDNTTPIDVTGADTITAGTEHTTTGITTTKDNTLLITVLAFDGANGSTFTAGTGSVFTIKSQPTQGSANNGIAFMWSEDLQASSGSSGASVTDSSSSDGAASFMFAINKAPSTRRIFHINK